jgi:hypothetical protein
MRAEGCASRLPRGHFYIDLLLFFTELFGVVYYFRLARKKYGAAA